MIMKHDIPILEFDTDPSAVLMPAHENLPIELPKKAVFAFLEGHIDEYAKAHGARVAGEFQTITKSFLIYILPYKGEEICLCQAPLGSAAAVQMMDWLIGYGVKEVNPAAMQAIEKALKEHGLAYREVVTWTTDGFFRETKDMVAYRKEEGCEVVEMECAGLAACASFRGAVWGCLLFTADTLADVEHYDERGWGEDSFACALELCLDAAVHIG